MTLTYTFLEQMKQEFAVNSDTPTLSKVIIEDYLRFLKRYSYHKKNRAQFPTVAVLRELRKQAKRSEKRNMEQP